jgi:GNAT superfamily N-acetyltransferase
MHISEVHTSADIREFLELPRRLYKNEKNWISPLDRDIEAVFDKDKNNRFKNGECIRWILKDDAGKTIGRIAAFIDKSIAYKENQPTGGTGFFECIDNQQAANLLFDTSKKWLAERGMEAMDGPINFGDRDKFWGLLVDGFYEPNYGMFYHFPYYKQLFETYGFKEYFKQFTYRRDVMAKMHDLIEARAQRLYNNPDYSFQHIDKKNLEKYIEDFRIIYNKAWVKHLGVAEMTPSQAKQLGNGLKSIMDEQIIWYMYYKNQPIAFFVCLPELNQTFKYINGKLNLTGVITFLWHKWRKTCRKMFGVAFGVIPEFQGKGIEGAIIIKMRDIVQKSYRQYDDFEMNWIGDFNTTMIKMCQLIGGEVVKTHATYRKLFDESKPFERHPITN